MNGKRRSTRTDWAKVDATAGIPDEDSPELTQEMADRGTLYDGNRILSGPKKRGRPVGSKKTSINVRVDMDVLAYYKSTGRGWQTRINATLRAAMPKPATSRKVAAVAGKR